MGQASGIISQEELEKYGGANIMLMNARDGMQSGTSGIVQSGTEWTITWTDDGYSGLGWEVDGWPTLNATNAKETIDSWATTNPATPLGFMNAIGGIYGYNAYTNNCIQSRRV